MWGICNDWDQQHKELFGKVVQYKIGHDSSKAIICSPIEGCQYEMEKIIALSQSPEYTYGERVLPKNHPEIEGRIAEIGWHFGRQQYFYIICVNGQKKSKRYFGMDLRKIEE